MARETYKYDDASYHYDSTPEDASEEDRAEMAGLHIGLMVKWAAGRGFIVNGLQPDDPDFQADLDKLRSGAMVSTRFLQGWGDEHFNTDMVSPEGRRFLDAYYGERGTYLDDYQDFMGDRTFEVKEKDVDFAAFSTMVDRRYDAFLAQGPEATTHPPQASFLDKVKSLFGR
jgi:hypothetical protein